MKSRCCAMLVVLLVLAGCGSTVTHTVTQTEKLAPFVCHHRVPAQAGECIRQELEGHGIHPAIPKLGLTFGAVPHRQCVDISVWQGVPNFRAARVRCVIIQTNDGGVRNRLFYAQVTDARHAGIPWGVYAFLEDHSGVAQANIALSMSQGLGRSLGVWADTEVPGAYQQACSFDARARRVAFIVGVYASPGNWPGYRCVGYIYPAEWGSGRAYPLAGYPASAVKIRQWCGTCRLAGFSGEVDRDEDLGLLALASSKPSPSHAALIRRRAVIRTLLTKHRCRPPLHAKPSSYHTACGYWLREGARINRQLKGQAHA